MDSFISNAIFKVRREKSGRIRKKDHRHHSANPTPPQTSSTGKG